MKIDPNAPASAYFSPECGTSHGLSIRSRFAAMAMQGYMANPTILPPDVSAKDVTPQEMAQISAIFAVMCADALIAELNK